MARRKAKTSAGLKSPKAKVNVAITPQSKSTLEKITGEMGLSRSALFEGILDGSICLSSQNAKQVINLTSSSENKSLDVTVSDQVEQVKPTPSATIDNEELKAQKEKISTLEKQIKEQESEISKSSDLNKSLQEKLDEQLSLVSDLKSKLAQTKSGSKLSGENQEVIDLINKKEENIKQLNQQIKKLEAEVDQHKKKDVVLTSKSSDVELESLNKRQRDTIARLEARIAELQTVASVGSHTLNKWRSKVYH